MPTGARTATCRFHRELLHAQGPGGASAESGILLMEPNGQLRLVYETGTSLDNWTFTGTYRVP